MAIVKRTSFQTPCCQDRPQQYALWVHCKPDLMSCILNPERNPKHRRNRGRTTDPSKVGSTGAKAEDGKLTQTASICMSPEEFPGLLIDLDPSETKTHWVVREPREEGSSMCSTAAATSNSLEFRHCTLV